MPINDDPGLEHEADVMGDKAAAGMVAQRIAQIAHPLRAVRGMTVQRAPIIQNPAGQNIDIGAAEWTPERLEKLLEDMPYQWADSTGTGRKIRREIKRKVALQPPPQSAVSDVKLAAGNAMISKQNAARHALGGGFSAAASETKPLKEDPEKAKKLAESTGKGVLKSAASAVVNFFTGNVSGMVEAGGEAAVGLAKAQQIQSLLDDAKAEAKEAKSQEERDAVAPAQLIAALNIVVKCLRTKAGGAAAGAAIPFAGTIVSALVAGDLNKAMQTIWAADVPIARRAAAILDIEEGTQIGSYESMGKRGGDDG